MILSFWFDLVGGILLLILLLIILYFIISESAKTYNDLLKEEPFSEDEDVIYTFRDLLSLPWIRRSCKTENVQCSTDKDCTELCLEGSNGKCKGRVCRYANEVTHECNDGCLSVYIGDTQTGNVINTCVNTSLKNMPDCTTRNEWWCSTGKINIHGECTVTSSLDFSLMNYHSGIGRDYPFVIKNSLKSYFLLRNPNISIK